MQKLVLLALILTSSLMAQSVSLAPYGISPRDAVEDTLDIFDRAYNGLLNVGVETQMYLKGAVAGAGLAAPTWTITAAPAGSAAAVTVTTDLDSATQVAVFTPDVVGTYVVEFANNGSTASVTINSGKYVGIDGGGCAMCHSGTAEKWQATGHADMLVRGLNGVASSHYGESCISCHTTGFDALANNDGFDDFEFVFPSVLQEGTYDDMLAAYPDAMKRANIQCESCHGPGNAHFGNTSDAKMVSSLSSDNCAICHDSGDHHIFPEQWDASRHGKPLYAARGASAGCAPCHSGAGFVAWIKGGKQNLAQAPAVTAITCATCHDPHSNDIEHQLRTDDVTLLNGQVVEEGGLGKLCMNCHKSRRNAAEYTGPNFAYNAHFGPHYGVQTELLMGMNLPTFGKKLPSSAHNRLENACVDCHMAETHEVEQAKMAGGHTFRMVSEEGLDHVEACAPCHGEIESFAEKKFYFNGEADHDDDGVEEGLQEEVHGMLEELAKMLPPLGEPTVDISGKYVYTETDAKAAYNWFAVEDDRSFGIHNPAFTVALLKVSMQAVANHALEGGVVEIMDVPNDQGKQVRIVWNKAADDGVAVDPIATYVVKRQDNDETWTNVGEATADGSGRYALVVATLYDSTATTTGMTEFKVVAVSQNGSASESAPAAGYSIDNLIPATPANLIASANGADVNLRWDDPVDADFNYFAVYRGTQAGFAPTDENLVATTTGVELTDAGLALEKTYYYQVYAFDFSGNRSGSSEISILITGVDANGSGMPTEFSLAQNYPNPFNPSTTIEFAVPAAGDVTIDIYDIRGAHVRTLAQGQFAAGYHSVMWNGLNDGGLQVANGTYVYRLSADGQVFTKKMVFLK